MSTIVELQVENVKRLKAIKIEPKGSTVVISGKNDQGKSSALDAIDYAFRGEKSICEEPIRQGEKRARVKVMLSEELENVCTIERRFTPGGSVLEVRNQDGVPQKTPQALLDGIIAKIAFDPLSFVRMKPQEQMELLRKLVGLDFTELNSARLAAYNERTIRNRELESAKKRLEGYPFDVSLPKEPVSIQDLALALGEARSRNENNNRRREEVTRQGNLVFDLASDIKGLEEKVKTLEQMLADAKAQIGAKTKQRAEAAIEHERMTADIAKLQNCDERAVQSQIDRIQQTNAGIEANNRHLKAREDVETLEKVISGLNAKIKECDDDKAAQIEFARFPMDGLSFDEQRGVLLNGVPFSQGSQARQLQAAVAIGLALNPKVRVIIIRDGSLLDEDSLKAVSETAAQNKAQLWIEVVNSKDPSAIVIEDGEIK